MAPGYAESVHFDMFKTEGGGATGFRWLDAQHPWFTRDTESIRVVNCANRVYLPTIATDNAIAMQ